ncbi:MAG: hypothetical protein RJA36_1426 [Pseudomonadota bacterium]|jgi:hypothetical protein
MANPYTKFTYDQIKHALEVSGGIMAAAARYLTKTYKISITRSGVAEFVKRHPELREIREEAREELLDRAEENLRYHLLRRSEKTTFYVLNQIGGARGYGFTRLEHTGAGGGPILHDTAEDRPDFSQMTDEELQDFLAQRMARA